MKRTIIFILFLSAAVLIGAQSLNQQIRNLAVEITRGYMDGHKNLLIKPRIGIGDFSNESAGAVKNSVGSLVSVMLTDELSRSTVFQVIERRDLDALMKEYKLSLSGFTSESTAPQLGELQGVELLVLGSVAEQGDSYVVSARLVEVETGKIITSARITAGRKEIEQESEKYIASTFQSPYGITLSPNATGLIEIGGNSNGFFLFSVDAGYRVAKWLSFSLGYVSLLSREMQGLDTPKISGTTKDGTTYTDVSRYFRFSASGISLASEAVFSPTVRLSLGARLGAVLYVNPVLEQDFPDFPVWLPNSSGNLISATDRIIVTGFNHSLYASYHLSLSAAYLVSPRLSLFARAGGFYLPEFVPTSFEIAGSVRDTTINSDADIDTNGTFPQYHKFNFSRNSSGERVGFSALGVSFQLGMAVNF